jgi:hypothetical protein
MNKLLAGIVEAHGGLDRWRRFNRVEATLGGAEPLSDCRLRGDRQ